MHRFVYMLRFFWLVAPLPPLMAPAMLAAGLVAVGVVIVDPGRAAAAMAPLLLLQMFATSSGFMVPARRGHYDLLLTGGFSRGATAAVHWVVSALPGVAIYLAVVVAALIASGADAGAMQGPGAWLALALVSTVPWAATVALPRFTAAIAWLVLIAATVAVLDADALLLVRPLESGVPTVLALVLLVLNPVALVGVERLPGSAVVTLPLVLLAGGSLLAATAWASRQDIPLEAPQ